MKEIKWSDISLRQLDKLKACKDNMELVKTIFNIQDINSINLIEFNKYIKAIEPLTKHPIPEIPKFDKIKDYQICTDFSKFTVAQYVDYQNCKKDDFVELCKVILVPKGKKYGTYDTDKLGETLKDSIDVQTAVNIVSFFQNASLIYSKNLLYCLRIVVRLATVKKRLLLNFKRIVKKIVRLIPFIK